MIDDLGDMPPWARDAFLQMKKGNASAGIRVFEQHANAGDPAAMSALYKVYSDGWGVEKNRPLARSWLTRAANLDYGPALFNLSGLYARGDGVESSKERMFEYAERAGQLGHSPGYVALGLVHEQGDFGVPVNAAAAASYYEKACNQGSARAKFFLGRLYISGEGVARSTKRGFELFEEAAEQGDEEALSALGELYASGRQGHVEDEKLAVKYFRRAARLGHQGARTALQERPATFFPLGQKSCSAGLAPLHPNDRTYLLDRHAAGVWGDVSPEEWDRNDRALAAGDEVQSVHRSGQVAVVIRTNGPRTATYMELEGEGSHSGHFSVVHGVKEVKEVYEWYHFAKGVLSLFGGGSH